LENYLFALVGSFAGPLDVETGYKKVADELGLAEWNEVV
jgi:hypothetical protein